MNASSDVRLKDLRIRLRDKDYVPLMVGGMGVNISTAEMVLAIEKLGGIAHISDAMAMDLSDRLYGTQFTANKAKRYYGCQKNPDKSDNHFDLNDVREASLRYVGDVMSRATGNGLVFLNCMENSPTTLRMNRLLFVLMRRWTPALTALHFRPVFIYRALSS